MKQVVLLGLAFAAAIILPVAWYWKIVIFIGAVFVVGAAAFVIGLTILRGDDHQAPKTPRRP